MMKEITVLQMNKETGEVYIKNARFSFSIDDGEAMTIRIGDEVLCFRFEEVQEMIRQERMRNG